MITAQQCLARYGAPEKETSMMVLDVSKFQAIHAIPKRIYCNRDLATPLNDALANVMIRGLGDQIKTWDGCFNIRKKRGADTASLHSWGLAIDINASWNRFRQPPTMSPDLVACFTDAGFIWGGAWRLPDGMHMQLAELPT